MRKKFYEKYRKEEMKLITNYLFNVKKKILVKPLNLEFRLEMLKVVWREEQPCKQSLLLNGPTTGRCRLLRQEVVPRLVAEIGLRANSGGRTRFFPHATQTRQ